VKKLFGVVLVLALVLSFSLVATTPVVAQPAEVWVDDDFDDTHPDWNVTHFDNVQAGIDAVAAGGTVHIAAGTYDEALSVSQTVMLKGSGSDSTVVEPAMGGVAITIQSGTELTLTLQDIQLKASGSGRGINCNARTEETNIILEDCMIDYSQHGRGINVWQSPDTSVVLTGSTVDATDADGALSYSRGLQIWESSDSTVIITDSTVAAGHYALIVAHSENVEVSIKDGAAVTGYAAIAVVGSASGSVITVDESVLTGRTFWSGYSLPHADSFATVAFQSSDCIMHVTDSIITNEWVDGATSYQMLFHIGHALAGGWQSNKVYLDDLTQLVNTNKLYAPISVGGGAIQGNRWYISGVEQYLPPIIYDYYVHPDGDDSDGLTPIRAFKTIQDALNAAGPDNTILVGEGAYADFDPWLDTEVASGMIALGENAVAVTHGVSAESTAGSTSTVLSVARFVGNPTGVDPGLQVGALFFDVHVGGTEPDTIQVRANCPSGECSGMILKWYDGTEWISVSPVLYTNGEAVAELNNVDSSPRIFELAGTPFSLGNPTPLQLPVTVGWEGSSVSKVAVMAPWLVLFAAMIAGVTLVAVRRRGAQV